MQPFPSSELVVERSRGGGALLRRTLGAVRRDVAACIAAGLAWQAVAIAIPWVLERAVDEGVVAGDRDALWRWSAALVALGVVRWVGDAARHWWVERAGAHAAQWLRRQVVGQLLTADDESLARFDHGDLTARAISDTDKVWSWLSGLATYVTAGGTLVAVLVLLVTLDPWLAVVGVATVPVAAAFSLRQVAGHNRLTSAVAAANGAHTSTVESALGGIRAVKGVAAEEVVLARITMTSRTLRARSMDLARAEAWWLSAGAAIPAAGLAAGLWIGGTRAIDGDITVGTLVAFAGWMALLVDATETLTDRLATRGAALAAAARLDQLFALPAVHERAADTMTPTGNDITVDGVAVVRGERTVLSGVDLDVPAGRWLAFVGPTGGGKTTLLRTLAGTERPRLGHVRVGGVDVHAMGDASAVVTYVPQHPSLVSGTLAKILRLAAPAADDAALERAIEAAAARDILHELGGLGGRIGDRGHTLSGGQRQRVALAAAILRRPEVLLLDDVTSALDPATELRVLDGLRHHLADTTVVLATHREAAAAACDTVLLVADGGLVLPDDATWRSFVDSSVEEDPA